MAKVMRMTILSAKIPSTMLGIFAFILVSSSFFIVQDKDHSIRMLIPPPPYAEHMTIGYKEVLADVMWIRTIQDLDYCDQNISENICRNESWLYKMIDAITSLSPHFRMPYAAGSLALTVIISDIDGATKIFDKGIRTFPKDWQILYSAAYHYLYEVKDKKRAAELLIQAGKNGAPPFVFTLAGRLYSDSGYLDLAESILKEMIANKRDPILIQRLKDKIVSMRASSSAKKFK